MVSGGTVLPLPLFSGGGNGGYSTGALQVAKQGNHATGGGGGGGGGGNPGSGAGGDGGSGVVILKFTKE